MSGPLFSPARLDTVARADTVRRPHRPIKAHRELSDSAPVSFLRVVINLVSAHTIRYLDGWLLQSCGIWMGLACTLLCVFARGTDGVYQARSPFVPEVLGPLPLIDGHGDPQSSPRARPQSAVRSCHLQNHITNERYKVRGRRRLKGLALLLASFASRFSSVFAHEAPWEPTPTSSLVHFLARAPSYSCRRYCRPTRRAQESSAPAAGIDLTDRVHACVLPSVL